MLVSELNNLKAFRGDQRDSNPQPPESQSRALPIKLWPHLNALAYGVKLGIEPSLTVSQTVVLPLH